MDATTTIAKCHYFRQLGLWPREEELNFEGWLSNFLPEEKEYAIALLGQFIYYSHTLTNQLFQATLHGLSRMICKNNTNYRSAKITWTSFLNNLILTRVTGEDPNDTDSGFQYVRMARDLVGISQKQIMDPESALEALISNPRRPIVFVDDFLGSGSQFNKTWKRLGTTPSQTKKTSFAEFFSNNPDSQVYYCVPISTAIGISNVKRTAPQVKVESSHIFTESHSAISSKSKLWPTDLRLKAIDFIYQASQRAGISKVNAGGFENLGLTVAFEHGIPDASLPIFYAETNGWKPLKRKLIA